MKTGSMCLVLLVLAAAPAAAAPGDPVALRGTLAWPPTLSGEPFLVLRSEEGRLYYVDVSSAQRAGGRALSAGGRMSLVGIEGSKPHEVSAVAIGPEDSVVASLPPDATRPSAASPAGPMPGAPAPTEATPAEPDRPWERIEGTVESVSDRTLTLQTSAGRRTTVNVSKLGANVLETLKPGERIIVFAVREPDDSLNAVGLVHARRRQAR